MLTYTIVSLSSWAAGWALVCASKEKTNPQLCSNAFIIPQSSYMSSLLWVTFGSLVQSLDINHAFLWLLICWQKKSEASCVRLCLARQSNVYFHLTILFIKSELYLEIQLTKWSQKAVGGPWRLKVASPMQLAATLSSPPILHTPAREILYVLQKSLIKQKSSSTLSFYVG